jgi:hypothetical protein
VRLSLADSREIKSSLGGTLNDVVLTVTASGLRALLQSRGEALPAGGLRAMVPMNVRVASEHLALWNRISSLFLELPVAEADPVRRYHETVARSESVKSDGQQAEGTTAVIELAGLAPPVIHATIAQALYATRLFNVTITNMPGPQQTLYAFGAPLREVHPLVPLAPEHAVGVPALSYDGYVLRRGRRRRHRAGSRGVAERPRRLGRGAAGGGPRESSRPHGRRSSRATRPPATRSSQCGWRAIIQRYFRLKGTHRCPNDRLAILNAWALWTSFDAAAGPTQGWTSCRSRGACSWRPVDRDPSGR